MKEFVQKKWQLILIVVLLLFGMNKCTQSCNRQGEIDRISTEYAQLDSLYNSDVAMLIDSIKTQQHQLSILEERVSGLRNMNEAVSAERANTEEANKRADAAQRRISELNRKIDNISK